jgi:FAD synthase
MRPVSVTGVIKRYKGNGRALGYPTANLSVPVDLKDGVYFGFADLAEYERQPALIFIGVATKAAGLKPIFWISRTKIITTKKCT